ncbi:MAG: hypothetical protein H0U98_08790 [Alphaproteobacteria bacterium]|nr:hypothetical protein [Alphaproteobacteria bacterium]
MPRRSFLMPVLFLLSGCVLIVGLWGWEVWQVYLDRPRFWIDDVFWVVRFVGLPILFVLLFILLIFRAWLWSAVNLVVICLIFLSVTVSWDWPYRARFERQRREYINLVEALPEHRRVATFPPILPSISSPGSPLKANREYWSGPNYILYNESDEVLHARTSLDWQRLGKKTDLRAACWDVALVEVLPLGGHFYIAGCPAFW